jgi:beta-lactamase regulating signal transducer with metallopeptidase domain
VNDLVQIGLTNALLATVLAVVAAIVGKVGRRPALSHALWLLVLLKLLTPPLVVIPLAWPQEEVVKVDAAPPAIVLLASAPVGKEAAVMDVPPIAQADPVEQEDLPPADVDAPAPVLSPIVATTPALPAAPEPAWSMSELPWLSLLGGLWLSGLALWCAIAALRVWRFHKLLLLAQPASPELQAQANRLAARFGLRDCPGVWLMPGVWSPLLWAVAGCPRLLLPAGLIARLNPQQRATLLAHELAHYYRRDHWIRCLEFVATGLYWWLPVVWWVRRELSDAEEECCDAWVVWALPDAAKAYAKALVETLDFLSGSQPALPPVASGLGRLPLLRRRLTMIMRGTTPRKLTGLGFLVVLALAAVLLPLWPSWAQQSKRYPLDPAATDTQPQQNPADLKRTAEELVKLKQYLDMLKEDYDLKARALRDAERQIEKAKMAKAGPMTIEQRLTEIEKKLDQMLLQVRDLQKLVGKKGLTTTPYYDSPNLDRYKNNQWEGFNYGYPATNKLPPNPGYLMPQNLNTVPTPRSKKSEPNAPAADFAPVFPGGLTPPGDFVPDPQPLPDGTFKTAPTKGRS